MNKYPSNPDDWNLEFVKELVDEEHEENAFLEYKQSLKDNDKSELEKEFTAFANARGGFILFGVTDDHSICGIENLEDEELTQYVKELVGNTNPLIDFHVGDPIEIAEERALLVVKVEEIDKKPVKTKESAFTRRIGESKQPMPREEIRHLFLQEEKEAEARKQLINMTQQFLNSLHVYNVTPDNRDDPPAFWVTEAEKFLEIIRENRPKDDEEIDRKLQDMANYLTSIRSIKHRYESIVDSDINHRQQTNIAYNLKDELHDRVDSLREISQELLEELDVEFTPDYEVYNNDEEDENED